MKDNISIRIAAIEDMERIYLWSNDPITRKNSFSSEPIIWENHIIWFKTKLQSETSVFYIIENKMDPIAFVHFTKKEETTIGITVAPEARGKGFASKCIIVACKEYKKQYNETIYAYIKTDNIASQKACFNAGFLYIGDTFIKGNPCYKLKF